MAFLYQFFIIYILTFSFFAISNDPEIGEDIPSSTPFLSLPQQSLPFSTRYARACGDGPGSDALECSKLKEEEKRREDETKAERKERRRTIEKEEEEKLHTRKLEAFERRKDEITARKEECKTAQEEYEQKIKDKKDNQKSMQEAHYDLEQQITEIEEQMAEEQREMATALNELQNTTNQNVQAFKDEMKEQIEEQVNQAIKKMQDTIAQLQTKQESIKNKTNTAYFNRRQAINKLYVICFTEATEKRKVAKQQFIAKKQAGQIKKTNLQSLAKGTKQNIKIKLQEVFDRHLNSCLQRPDIEIQRQDAQAKLVLVLNELNQMKINIKRQIAQLQNEIRILDVNKRVEIMTTFKERMRHTVKQFNKEYETKLTNFQAKKEQVDQTITKLKHRQKQESIQSQQTESTITPQDRQLNLLLYQCNNQSSYPPQRMLSSDYGMDDFTNSTQ